MNVQKLVNGGIEVAATATQHVSKKAGVVSDVISNVSNKGLDALASYNSGIVKSNGIMNTLVQKAKKIIDKINIDYDNPIELNDKEIEFVVSKFVDLNAKYPIEEVEHIVPALDKFSQLDETLRAKLMNSEAIKLLMDLSSDKGFRFSCFNITLDEIDKLDEFLSDDLIKYCFENYLHKNFGAFTRHIKMLLPDFVKVASNLKNGFCSAKQAPMFYDLLKKRNYKDIEELTNIILANTKNIDDDELNEFYKAFEKLVDAKTPDGKFIFGVSKASDTTSKNMLSGIENILQARKNSPSEYEQYLKLLELTQNGTVSPKILGTMAKEGKITPDFMEAINRKLSAKSHIIKFDSFDIAKAQAKLGDTVQIGEKLFYKNKDELVELNLSAETFEQLFPEIETMALGQGELGDCYLISAIYDFIKNPNAKGKVYQMFSEDGDDIIVKIPDAQDFPIRFSKKILTENGEQKVNGSLGIQMLEDAYSQTRALKYGVVNSITTIEGGNQMNVYNALLGTKNSGIWTTSDIPIRTPQEIDEEIAQLAKQIQEKKSTIKNLQDSNDISEHLEYLREQESIDSINKLQAIERMMHEEKTDLVNYHQISESELLERLLDTSLDGNLVSIGTKCDEWLNKDKLIHGRHAYSVLNVDKLNQTIDIVNPWNTAQYTTISFKEFLEYFDTLNIAKL